MQRSAYRISLIVLIAVVLSACGGSGSSTGSDPAPAPQRGYYMGFTPWPYDATQAAVNDVYEKLHASGDIIAHHLDGGIPWQEALDGDPLPTAVSNEIADRVARTADSQCVYLALSPLNSARDDLADYWNDSGTNQSLPAAWAARTLDSNEVITAYTNFASILIDEFQPQYFNYCIEASELAMNDAAHYNKLLTFSEQVSSALRLAYPDLKLMISVGLKSPGSSKAVTINTALPALIEDVDMLGISVYPYAFFEHADKGDPANLPSNWLSQIQTIADGKPLAIAETGWVAEDLVIPTYSLNVPATEADQNAYVTTLLKESEALDMEFIIWFSVVDFDALWSGAMGSSPLGQIWRDTGLYDEDIQPRAAFATWMQYVNRSLRNPKSSTTITAANVMASGG